MPVYAGANGAAVGYVAGGVDRDRTAAAGWPTTMPFTSTVIMPELLMPPVKSRSSARRCCQRCRRRRCRRYPRVVPVLTPPPTVEIDQRAVVRVAADDDAEPGQADIVPELLMLPVKVEIISDVPAPNALPPTKMP